VSERARCVHGPNNAVTVALAMSIAVSHEALFDIASSHLWKFERSAIMLLEMPTWL